MNYTKTYQRSLWAKRNRPVAIVLIIISKVLIGISGFVLGIMAWHEGLSFESQNTQYFMFAVSVFCLIAYPTKKLREQLGKEAAYLLQKRLDGVLVAFGFLFFLLLGNMSPIWVAQPVVILDNPSQLTTAVSSLEKPVAERRKELVRGGKLKHWVIEKAKSKVKRLVAKVGKKNDTLDGIAKFIFFLLLVVLSIGLGYLVLAWSCSLACAGQESLAAVVLIGGMAGVIALLIFGSKTIFNSGKPSRPVEEKVTKPTRPPSVKPKME